MWRIHGGDGSRLVTGTVTDFSWVPAPFLAVAGLALTFSAVRDIWSGHASTRWPTTRARVLSSDYHLGTSRGGDTSPLVRYEYLVAGTRYESIRYAFSGKGTGANALSIALKYADGDLVTVHYDPLHPDRSCLHPGAGIWNYAMLILGLFFLFAGGAWLSSALPN